MMIQKRFYVFLVLCILNILLLFSIENSINFFTKTIYNSTNFFQYSVSSISFFLNNFSKIIKTNRTLMNENKILKSDIEEYQKSLKSIEALLFENKKLRELVEFSFSTEYQLVSANILINSQIEGSSIFTINKGKKSGVNVDYIVCGIYKKKLVLVGQVISTNRNTAIFRSIKSKGYSIPIQTEFSEQKGFLIGDGIFHNKLDILFDSLYDAKYVFVGEEILLSANSSLFPKAIPIGVIADLESDEEDLLIKAILSPYLDPYQLDVVFVVVPNLTIEQNIENLNIDSLNIDSENSENQDNDNKF